MKDIEKGAKPVNADPAAPAKEVPAAKGSKADKPEAHPADARDRQPEAKENAKEEKQGTAKAKSGWRKWAFGGAILAAVAIAAVFLVPRLLGEDIRKEAYAAFEDKRYATAHELFNQLMEADPIDQDATILAFRSLVEMQEFSSAFYFFSDHVLPLPELTKDNEDRLRPAFELLDNYYLTQMELDKIESVDVGEIRQALEGMVGKGYSDALLHFYLANMETDPAKALPLFQQAYEMDPRYYFILRYVANSQWHQEDYVGAVQTYETVLTRNKEDYEALRGIAMVALLQGDAKKAVKYAKQARDIIPDNPSVALTLLIAYKEAGDTGAYNGLKTEMAEFKLENDPALNAYFSGDITVRQLLLQLPAEVSE